MRGAWPCREGAPLVEWEVRGEVTSGLGEGACWIRVHCSWSSLSQEANIGGSELLNSRRRAEPRASM